MSDQTYTVIVNNIPPAPQGVQWQSQLMGAILAIVGGFFAVIIRIRIERKQEINHIKIGLIDELEEVCSIISKLKETYNATTPHFISNIYLSDLSKNTESFTFHKAKFFLISNSELRKEINVFYKKLTEKISESINKVGQLGSTETGNEHNQIIAEFTTLSTEAASIKTKIEKYKYKALWIC